VRVCVWMCVVCVDECRGDLAALCESKAIVQLTRHVHALVFVTTGGGVTVVCCVQPPVP